MLKVKRQVAGVTNREISVMIVGLRSAAMYADDHPFEVLQLGTSKNLDARAIASFVHETKELADRIEKKRVTQFGPMEHQLILAALRLVALKWPDMAKRRNALDIVRAQTEKFAAEAGTLADKLNDLQPLN